MVSVNADGTRTIGLFIKVESLPAAITLKPVTLDTLIRWQAREIASPMALLAELSEIQEPMLGLLCYPDVDRVLTEFAAHLPDSMRQEVFARTELASPRRRPVEAAPDSEQGAEAADYFPEGGETADLGMDLGDGRRD